MQQAHAGDCGATEKAYTLLYPELLKIARARLRVHQAPSLLDTQALVHERFLRFVGGVPLQVASRKHFYAYAAEGRCVAGTGQCKQPCEFCHGPESTGLRGLAGAAGAADASARPPIRGGGMQARVRFALRPA